MVANARWAGVARGAGVGVLLLLGCSSSAPGGGAAGTGGGAAGTGGGAAGTGGGAHSTRIIAANGGKVTDPGGTTTLTIPAGALAMDTDITLQIIPKYAEALVPVSVFGPAGLAFSKAATLAIKADPSLMPAGTELVIGLEGSDGAFAPVAGSAYAGGVATAPVMHFSNYTVMVGAAHPKCASVGQGCGNLAN